MKYLLDANVLISAKNLHYGFEFCPGFWSWLDSANEDGIVGSIDKVGNELSGGDALAVWARQRNEKLFLTPDSSLGPALTTVSTWATSQSYTPAAISTFFQVADYFLVAAAAGMGATVVTHEIPSNSTKKIKIPDVCLGIGVKWISPFDMLRQERALFVLGAAQAP